MDGCALDYLRTWYAAQSDTGQARNFASPTAEKAFQEGLDRFATSLTSDARKVELARRASSIHDIEALVRDSLSKYSDETRYPRLKKWLQRAVSKIHYYGNIMDVLVQHHPEYVALAWGAMKLVLVSAQNHEDIICLLSKALSQIADSLPRVELASVLYPTERMRKAIGNLYANLVRFFIRAYDWCCEGPLRHLIHSITRPIELRYKDLLEDIAADSREIDQLATSGSRVEIREINLKLTDIVAKLESFHALQSSSLLDTNQRLCDLQFSQIMSYISTNNLGDPLEAFRFNQSMQRLQSRSRYFETTNKFWLSPKLGCWTSKPESSIIIAKGGFRARSALRKFSVDIIQQLQARNVPVFWVLRGPESQNSTANVSAIDLFKHLVLQALCLEKSSITESRMSLQCSRFQTATTEKEWIQLLGSILARAMSQIYLVIDLSTLDHRLLPMDDFSWILGFQNLFAELGKQSQNLQLKVLLLGAGVTYGMQDTELFTSDIVIPVNVTQVPARERKRMHRQMGPQRRDHQQQNLLAQKD